MKKCNKCNVVKGLEEFYRNRALKDGRENSCKECRNSRRKRHSKICKYCGSSFETQNIRAVYCSNKCKPQSRRKRVGVSCFICGEIKEITNSHKGMYKHFYCSNKCRDKGYGALYSGENSVHYNTIKDKCFYCKGYFERWESQILSAKRSYCSKECRAKDFRHRFSGGNNPNWNPDKSKLDREVNRNIEGYNEWRRGTFERDKYTCQCCGDNKGGNLVAHHIHNYSEHPEIRTCLSNSITLCSPCHKEFHDTYGYTSNNRRQLDDYLTKYRQQIS